MNVLLVSNKVKTYALAFQNEIEPLLELGHTVTWAADFSSFQGDISVIPCNTYNIDVRSNPIALSNVKAYRQLKKLVKEQRFDVVQCGTPIGGALGRLIAKFNSIPFVIYEAHGFLFFKGAPLINQTLFKWQEHIMSRWTDVLITINDEDYRAAKKMKLKRSGKLFMIHGAGVEIGKNDEVPTANIREELGISDDSFVLISAGILNKNKNNATVIRAMSKLNDGRVHYIICGEGPEETSLKTLAKKYGLESKVHFLGFRTDVPSLMKACNCFVMPSFREGVPRALLEAMDLGLPCVGSRTRGITELIGTWGGILCDPKSAECFAQGIGYIVNSPEKWDGIAAANKEEAKKYSKEIVRAEYLEIYREVLI